MDKSGIYCISVNDIGIYYGISVDIPRRWYQHSKKLLSGKHPNKKLQRCFLDLGPNAFDFVVIQYNEDMNYCKLVERDFILSDPYSLNDVGNPAKITQLGLPVKERYASKKLHLQKVGKLIRIRDMNDVILGYEFITGKWRVGTVETREDCTFITKLHPLKGKDKATKP